MINALNNHRFFLTASAAAAMVALSACGGADTADTGTEVAIPAAVTETGAETSTDTASATDTPVDTSAPTAGDATPSAQADRQAPTSTPPAATPGAVESTQAPASTETDQFVPASSADFLCETYVEATEYPVMACSKGDLVTEFQQWVAYVQPDFVVDGYFGPATYDAVVDHQLMLQMLDTGVIDELLMEAVGNWYGHAEPGDGDFGEYVEHSEDAEGWGDEPGEPTDFHGEELPLHDWIDAELCGDLADGLFPEIEVDAESEILCEGWGVRLTSGD
ncbi:MAG: peptidoglycan-binding protein [Actinomycetota bacterium]